MGLMILEILQGNRQQPKTEQEEYSNMFKKFSTHNPPTYDGKLDPTEFEEWLNNMEKLFDATQCPDKWKVNFAILYLKGQAGLWWKTAKEMHDQPSFGLEKLKEAMRRRFYPLSLQLQMELEFIHLKQRSIAINVVRKTKLQKEVYENGKRKGNSQGSQPSNGFKRHNTWNNNGQKQVPYCNKCNKLGHLARECRWGSDQCYRYGKPCHVIKDCPLGDRRVGDVTNRVLVRDQRVMQNSDYSGNTSNNNNINPPRGRPQAGRVFMMQREEVEADDIVITGTFPVNSIPAHVLFDSGASHSFISTLFAKSLKAKSCPEFSFMSVALPNCESVSCKIPYRDFLIFIKKCEFLWT
ncbi:uncharacterized protein LOC104899127 [Beta vulgaris subsp. vulgaris]|uniref:uncharacterized protein LOC104899127 n=1 Tax=Beta vulgaris subsp. vulgaris TaxID=3555 RepID=UPI00053F8077|nr:uncharacterized protein LOC104899127 [Beta vulgaris subsp. vulgaris]